MPHPVQEPPERDAPSFRGLDEISAPAAMLDRDGRVLHVNLPFAQMLGRCREELVGEPLARLVPENDQLVAQALKAARLRQSELTFTIRRSSEDQAQVQLLFRYLASLEQTYVLAVDRTPSKPKLERLRRRLAEVEATLEKRTADLKSALGRRDELQAALALSERKVETVLRAIPVGMWISSLRDGRHLDANEEMLGLLGCSREEFLAGRPPIGNGRQDAERLCGEVVASGRVRRRACACTASGESVPVLVWAERFEIRGEPVLLGALIRDPERAAGLVAPESCAAPLQDNVVPSADHIHRQDMDEYLRSIVQALERLYGSPDVQVDVSGAGVLLDSRRATLVGLIVTELVTNALIHAFPEGRGGRIEVRLTRSEGEYRLQVADTGIGMASAIPTAPSALGLRLVQLYAQRLRARVNVEVSGGTRFTVAFPVENSEKGERVLGVSA